MQDFFISNQLSLFGNFSHGTQTTCADVHVAGRPIDLDTTMLHIQDEATTGAMLRVRYIITIHWLALANVTTACCHFLNPP